MNEKTIFLFMTVVPFFCTTPLHARNGTNNVTPNQVKEDVPDGGERAEIRETAPRHTGEVPGEGPRRPRFSERYGNRFESRKWGRTARDDSPAQRVLEHLRERVEIGLRTTRFDLKTTRSNGEDRDNGETFLGNVTRLEDEQDTAFNRFFIAYYPIDYLGVEWTYDRVKARTWNYNNGLSDGTVTMSGPIFSLVARYPNSTRFVPYVGIGRAMWDADFNEDDWWFYGYGNPESYADAGYPATSNQGLKRSIDVEGDDGTVLFAGLAVNVYGYFWLDVMMRRLDVEASALYQSSLSGTVRQERTGTFPLEHTSYSIGLRCTFY